MKGILNWQDDKVVEVFDEGTLWAVPFGHLLLENIPMRPKMDILDIGFGTGMPLEPLNGGDGEAIAAVRKPNN